MAVSGFFHEGWDYGSKVILSVGELGREDGFHVLVLFIYQHLSQSFEFEVLYLEGHLAELRFDFLSFRKISRRDEMW